MVHNTICHVEIQSSNLEASQAFYSALFGWRFSSFIPNMVVFGVGDQHIGGLMLVDKVEPGQSPSLWFRVKSLDAALVKAEELGAALLQERNEVPSVGWSAQIADPDGTPVGLVMYTEDAEIAHP